MSFSPALTFFLDRMQGFSTNTFKIESHAKTTAVAGDIIVFDLPSNAILSLRSFKVFANVSANEVASKGARLPPIQDLIERVEVSVGGIILSQGTNFVNVLTEAKKALEGDHTDVVMGHPEYCRAVSYVNSKAFAATDNEFYTFGSNDPLFCVDRFEGFLGTAEPRLLDSSILPEIRVRLTCATDNVLSTSTTTVLGKLANNFADESGTANGSGPNKSGTPVTGAKYKLSEIHATIECIGLADQTYDNMIAAMMSQQGFLEIPYKSYDLFQDAHTGSSRFTVSTQSLDRVWVAWRDANYNTQDTPIIVEGYKGAGGLAPVHGLVALVNNAEDIDGTTIAIDNVAGGTIKVGDFIHIPNATSVHTITRITALANAGENTTNTLTVADTITCVDNSPIVFLTDKGLPQFDAGGVLETNREKYVGRYFNFVEPITHSAGAESGLGWKAQLQLNGAYYPQFMASLPQLYQISKNSIQSRKCKDMSMRQYQKNYCVQCFRLNLIDSEQQRLLSGLDTRSVNLQGILATQGVLNNQNVSIYTESTSTLRCGPGRSVEIIN